MNPKHLCKAEIHKLIRMAILAGLIGVLYAGCTKDCIPGNYLFVLPHTVSPARTVYKVGDTISVSADFSHYILDIARNETFLLEDFSFQLAFSLYDLYDTIPANYVRAFSSCEILMEGNTNLFLDNIGPLGEYTYQDGRYRLGFKFRPIKPGFYALVQRSLTSDGTYSGIQKDFPGKCKRRRGPSVAAFVEVNNGDENNYHLLQDEHFEGATYTWRVNQQNFHRQGVFVFYVEE